MSTFFRAEKKIFFSLIFILIIFVFLAVDFQRNSNYLLNSFSKIDQDLKIKNEIDQVLVSTNELEANVNEFVISGNENILGASNHLIGLTFSHLEILIRINKEAKQFPNELSNLEKLITRKINHATRTVELRRNEGLNEALNFVATSNSSNLNDSIKKLVAVIYQDKELYITNFNSINKNFIQKFKLSFYILLVGSMIIFLIAIFLMKYYFKDRKHANDELRKSKDFLEIIIENTSSIIFIKDVSGRYIHINSQYEKLFHISKDEIKGKTDYDIFTKEIADEVRNFDLEVIKNKKLMEFEEDVPTDGVMRHYITVKFPLFDRDNLPYAVCGIATDITERKVANDVLLAQKDTVVDLFNNAPCGYHSTNRDRLIIEMNNTELKWLGYTRAEVIGKLSILDIFSKESQQQLEFYNKKIVRGELKTLTNIEFRFKRKDGSVFPVMANTLAIYDDEGVFLYTKTIVFDITLIKQAEIISSQN